MDEVEDNSVDTIITSPPYWGLRDYGEEANQIWGGDPECKHEWKEIDVLRKATPGDLPSSKSIIASKRTNAENRPGKPSQFCSICNAWHGQLGLEPTLELYLEHLLIITAECKRVLRPTGILYWNHADSYGDSGGSGGDYNKGGLREGQAKVGRNTDINIPAKCLCLQNFRLVERMIDEQGFVLRNTIQWNKLNSMPSSVKDRLTNKYEPVFMLVKNTKTQYHWNEKTGLMADRKPSKLQENIDWEWKECPRCEGTGRIIERLSKANTAERNKEPYKSNNPHLLRIKGDGKFVPTDKDCPRCKGIGKIKHSFWHSLDYWFDLDAIREPHKDASKNRYEYSLNGSFTPGSAYPNEKRERPQNWNLNPSGKNPGDVWSIPTQPYPEAHFACVDSKTKILTIDGWKNYKEIKWQSRIKIATYNLSKKVIEYQAIDYLKQYDFEGELIKVGNRDLDILTTPNHRSLVIKRSGKEEIVLAESLAYSDKIKVLAPVEYKVEYSVGKKWAELIGWIISEGHYKKGGYIEIYQNIGENEKRIDYLLKEIPHSKNIKEREYKGKKRKQVTWFIKKCAFVDWIYRFIPRKELNKLLVSLPKNELNVLFKSLIAGDGNIRQDDRMQFIQKSKECVDWFEILAMRLGYHTLTTKRKDGNCYAVFLTKKKAIGIRGTNGKGKSIQKVNHNGKVWCPKTPNGTWIAKRNGKIFITGNTFPEKLIIRPILSSCPEWICNKCGKARIRITNDKSLERYELAKDDPRYRPARYDKKYPGQGMRYHQTTTIGWTDCDCDLKDKYKPGVVLDPFAGSGTTLAMAKRLGRQFIGYEIVKSYIPLIRKRLEKEDTMFNRDVNEQFV